MAKPPTHVDEEPKIVLFKKKNEDESIDIDSIVYENGKNSTHEANLMKFFVKDVDSLGVSTVVQYDKNYDLEKIYYVGLPLDLLYNEDNRLKNEFLRVNGDTAFFDVDLLFYDGSQLKNTVALHKMQNLRVSKKKKVDCPSFGKTEDYSVECLRYEEDDTKNAVCSYYPGENGSMTFGETMPIVSLGSWIVNRKLKKGEYDENQSTSYCMEVVSNDCKKYFLDLPAIDMIFQVTIYRSNWALEDKVWREKCWSDKDLQKSFSHEKEHVYNGRNAVNYYSRKYLDKVDQKYYDSQVACQIKESLAKMNFQSEFMKWFAKERRHENDASDKENGIYMIDPSPVPTKIEEKEGKPCRLFD